MWYAKYINGRFVIGRNPDIGGVKGRNKAAIWKQIRRNAAYRRDMVKYNAVHFSLMDRDIIINTILHADGRKEVNAERV